MFTVLTRQPCEHAGFKALSRTPVVVALVVLIVSVVVLVAITLIQIHQKEVLLPGLRYGIVLDAGSSRTTVYVYQWPAEKENNTGVVSQTCKCSVKGGLRDLMETGDMLECSKCGHPSKAANQSPPEASSSRM